jgi:alanine racemase
LARFFEERFGDSFKMTKSRAEELSRFRRDAWIEIKLNNLEFNLQKIYQDSGRLPLIPVLKADAYGHGASVLARVLEIYNFVDSFAVASLDEALRLKADCLKRIMVLGLCPRWAFRTAIENKIELTLIDIESATALNQEALRQNLIAPVHIKVETGMNRIGVSKNEFFNLITEIEKFKNLNIISIFSHFADPENLEFSKEQLSKFLEITQGQSYKKHIASSKAARLFPESRLDMIRCGIELFGLENPELKPLLSLYSRISHIKKIPKGENVSYLRSWTASEDTYIATLPLGYADGVSRSLSNKFSAYLKNHKKYIKQVGMITMDQVMFDLGSEGQNIRIGEIVELIGPNCSIKNWTESLKTISYEIVCSLNLRLPRIYTRR